MIVKKYAQTHMPFANKLIRRHIPKGANIGKYRDAEIKDIENRINNYPLKIARIENCKRYVQKML